MTLELTGIFLFALLIALVGTIIVLAYELIIDVIDETRGSDETLVPGSRWHLNWDDGSRRKVIVTIVDVAEDGYVTYTFDDFPHPCELNRVAFLRLYKPENVE